MQISIDLFALVLAVVLTGYGVIGLTTGRVTASSYALGTKSAVTGNKALILATLWTLFGLIGTLVFGGHMLGVKQIDPLYDFVVSMLKSN